MISTVQFTCMSSLWLRAVLGSRRIRAQSLSCSLFYRDILPPRIKAPTAPRYCVTRNSNSTNRPSFV